MPVISHGRPHPARRGAGSRTPRCGHRYEFILVPEQGSCISPGAPGEPVTIRSYVHLLSDHVKAAHAAGWSLVEMDEGVVDDAWLQKKPTWQIYVGLPISFSMVWRHR